MIPYINLNLKKMKKNQILVVMLFAGIMFINCKNNDDDGGLTPPAATEFAAMRQDFLTGITQTKTLDAASASFTSPKGVLVNVHNLYLDGQPVTGDVQLSYIELFDIGSMALANRPLVGRNSSGTVGALVTGGEFFIEATQNGAKLDGSVELQVPASYTQGADPKDMTIWTIEDEESTLWVEGGGEMNKGNANVTDQYMCWLPFGWTNIDWLYSLPGEKTEVRVRVPDGYDGSNCSVYAAYLTMPNTLASFDVYDKNGKYFTEHTGLAPIGFQMFVIFISGDVKTGKFVYATKLETIAPNHYVTFAASDLRSGSIQEVINAINGLYN
jgi:hypothetical protein